MLYVLMGPSSTGKSSVAGELSKRLGGQVYVGKDYLRFARNQHEAWTVFKQKLCEATHDSPMIYVSTEPEDVERLRDIDGAIFIRFTASLETLKGRFAQRMNGKLPDAIVRMLERQLQQWSDVKADLCLDTSTTSVSDSTEQIMSLVR